MRVERSGSKTYLIALSMLGLCMLALLAAGSWLADRASYAVFVPTMIASGGVTIAASRIAGQTPEKAALFVILALAALMRLAVMLEEPFLSTDIYRYIWDGRIQASGINPYRYVPADPALVTLRDATIYPNINRADYAVTVYPPVAQMYFFAVTRISDTLTMMRLSMVGCESVVLAVMLSLLRQLQLPATHVVAWAWHPLTIWEIAHSGHVEALMVTLLMLGVWLLARNRALLGAIAVALAGLAKPYALVALPGFWRHWNWRLPIVVVATIGLCYLPYLGVGRGVLGFVASGYLDEEGLSDGQGFWLVGLVQTLLGRIPGLTLVYLFAAFGLLAWLTAQTTSRESSNLQANVTEIGMLLMAGLVLLSPNYPWYFLTVVPFIALGGASLSLPAWALTVAAPFLYRPVIVPHNDLTWKTLATVPFVIATFLVLARRRAGSEHHGALQWTK